MKTVSNNTNHSPNEPEDIFDSNFPADSLDEGLELDDVGDEITTAAPKDNPGDSLTDEELKLLERKKKEYWYESTEEAVMQYIKSDFHYYDTKLENYLKECVKKHKEPDREYVNELIVLSEENNTEEKAAHKHEIFRRHIQKPLMKLVENIIFNFKLFRTGVDIKTLQNDCVSFVYSKFVNFDSDKNTLAFSYFGTVAKHYLMGEKKNSNKLRKIDLDYDDHREEVDTLKKFELFELTDLERSYTLFNIIVDNIEAEVDKGHLTENDIKVGNVLLEIFNNHEVIGLYAKSNLYHIIKDKTDLQTKDITTSISKFKILYRVLKQEFIKRDVDENFG